ncbi:MAG TPA: hypothetical protein VIL97_11615, partial [Thermoanaerobaculia bacterium]
MLLLAVTGALPSFAATKQWVNFGGDGLWTNANNWSPNGVPSAVDTVEIGTDQTAGNVTLTTNATIAGLTLTDPYL